MVAAMPPVFITTAIAHATSISEASTPPCRMLLPGRPSKIELAGRRRISCGSIATGSSPSRPLKGEIASRSRTASIVITAQASA